MSNRKIAISVGILFFVQMITGMIGSSLIQAFVDGDPAKTPMTIGVMFMIASGLAVLGIGLLMYQVLKKYNQKLAFWYPVFRALELSVSVVFGIYLLTTLKVVPNHMLWLYIPTGIGGLIFTYLLFVTKIVPRPIALLGLVGYTALLLGIPVTLLSSIDMNEGAGMVILAPGGLFEFVFLPIWLIAKGFKTPQLETK
jgi:hypothetical protein